MLSVCVFMGYQFQDNAPRKGGQKGQHSGRMNGQMPGGRRPGNQIQPFGQQQAPQR